MNSMMKIATFAIVACSLHAHAGVIGSYAFDAQTLSAHNPQNESSYSIQNEGSALILGENAWFGVSVLNAFGLSSLDLRDPLTSYVLNLDFRLFNLQSSGRSEIAGVYFGDFSRRVVDQDPARTVVFSGTQRPGNPYGIRDFDYNFSSSDWVSFSLNLDDFISGEVTDIIFLNDCDDGCADLNVGFRNLSLSSEVNEPTAVTLALVGLGFIGWRVRRQNKA